MPTYPSKKRYDAKNIVKVAVGFNRNTEPELVSRIEKEPNRAGYLKSLVREALEREKTQGQE
uniref:Uncharacterized protein n=1 Tax=Muribaculaceae bacterium Z82 TaxID=2304548 RepID=A0A7C9NUA2_9BACT